MGGIFLSYRREDAAGYSGRLADALREKFGKNVIFRDVDTITPGTDFPRALNDAVAKADVLLAVIGPRWLTVKDDKRRRRIDDPEDYVRLEIAAALDGGQKVVPVLVDGARLPRPEAVPEPLRPLLQRHAIELTDSRWSYDVGLLLDELLPVIRAQEGEKPSRARLHRAHEKARPLRARLAVGLLSALLVGGLIAGVWQSRQTSNAVATDAAPPPSSTTMPPTSSSSSVPETTTTLPAPTTAAERRPVPPPPTSPSPPTSTGTTSSTTTTQPPPSYLYEKLSGDGAFGAYKTADRNHYVVRKLSTNATVLTTHPQYVGDPDDANNDVKVARFCSGENLFAAAYHYWGGTSIYSWVGYWSTATGQFVRQQAVAGEVYSLDPYC